MRFPLTLSTIVRLPYCSHCTKSFDSAVKKELYYRTRGALTSLIRIYKLAEGIYEESHCGFRAKRSTVEILFSPRQLEETCSE